MAQIPTIQWHLPAGALCLARNARPSDAAALIDHVNRVAGESPYLAWAPGQFPLSVEEEKKVIKRLSEAANSLFLVAEVDDNIIGITTLEGSTKPRMQHVAELGVSVIRDYWRQGIGRKSMEIAVDWAEQNPTLRKLNLTVHEHNDAAIALYSEFGFVREGVISRLLCIDGADYDCFCMGRAV